MGVGEQLLGAIGLVLIALLFYAEYLIGAFLLGMAFSNNTGHEVVGAILFVAALCVFIPVSFLALVAALACLILVAGG